MAKPSDGVTSHHTHKKSMLASQTVETSLNSIAILKGKSFVFEPMSQGVSHQIFKVSVTHTDRVKGADVQAVKHFAAKSLIGHQHSAEQELAGTCGAAKHQLAPQVVYYDYCWLITEFIEGTSLVSSGIPLRDKIKLMVKSLAGLHQLPNPLNVPKLSLINVLTTLVNDLNLPTAHNGMLAEIVQVFTSFNSSKSHVLCHGDANFSNLVVDNTDRRWLVDFECACIAPIEYDLAMFMASNHIQISYLTNVITYYQECTNTPLNETLIRHYLPCCYLMNGLWYWGHGSDGVNYMKLAEQQFNAFKVTMSDDQWVIRLNDVFKQYKSNRS